MNPDERNMLTDLANKIAQTPAPPKDAEAEEFIRAKIGSRPDALYLMTQTVLIQNLALQHAQDELQQRRSQSTQPSSNASFLGQGQVQSQSRTGGYSQGQQYSAPPPPPQYAPSNPQYAPAPTPGAAPSFLKGAATTAAGVAAGALAFEGIQSLFSHPGYGGGGSGFLGGGGGGFGGSGLAGERETVINNYYDSPQDSGGDSRSDRESLESGSDLGNSDSGDNDTSNVDDSSYDDSGSSDDSGGGDLL